MLSVKANMGTLGSVLMLITQYDSVPFMLDFQILQITKFNCTLDKHGSLKLESVHMKRLKCFCVLILEQEPGVI